jgi:hypothetical protein
VFQTNRKISFANKANSLLFGLGPYRGKASILLDTAWINLLPALRGRGAGVGVACAREPERGAGEEADV